MDEEWLGRASGTQEKRDMRKTYAFLLPVLVVAGLALAQGERAEKIREKCNATPGFVQDDFFGELRDELRERLGNKRGDRMMNYFGRQDITAEDALKILNGNCTKKNLQESFGAKRSEIEKVREALDAAVESKDKSGFFGILLDTMIGDFSVDPTGEFAKQACGARDQIDAETWEKMIKKGNHSTRTIADAFGFTDKDDQKFMRKIVDGAAKSPLGNHPMLGSLGTGDSRRFNPKDFRKASKDMAGYGKNADGLAGGVPFDTTLPPMPYFGKNARDALKGGVAK